ncbi:major pollen allergen Ole e 10-like [Dioscorea cayenensis subsp. rotundata]|uniref:Major pollen allergen Ole e 10-like n=1 Tax=Dioscorea cayennensis subsp. rotundata TaxID=55577 RepID=A0AB40CNF9_DIOCR|nr:major pollen allergen Ole e 10-like [Dioscorea cayenensis subsp. rotundata]
MGCSTIIGVMVMALLVLQLHSTTLADGKWCVASANATDGPLQEALDWACSPNGGAANCSDIQETGTCYIPNTVKDHASYAFNSYWQLHRDEDDSCNFNGLAIETSTDPSHDNCHFSSTAGAAKLEQEEKEQTVK